MNSCAASSSRSARLVRSQQPRTWDERNPAAAQEFQGMDDKELQDLVADHVADYIQATLEDRV